MSLSDSRRRSNRSERAWSASTRSRITWANPASITPCRGLTRHAPGLLLASSDLLTARWWFTDGIVRPAHHPRVLPAVKALATGNCPTTPDPGTARRQPALRSTETVPRYPRDDLRTQVDHLQERESDHTVCAARGCDSMVVSRSQAQSHPPSHPQSQAIRRKPLHLLTTPNRAIHARDHRLGQERSRERPAETCGFAARRAFLRHARRRVAPGWICPSGEGGRAGVAVRRSARGRRRSLADSKREADSYGTDGVSTCFARSPLALRPKGDTPSAPPLSQQLWALRPGLDGNRPGRPTS